MKKGTGFSCAVETASAQCSMIGEGEKDEKNIK